MQTNFTPGHREALLHLLEEVRLTEGEVSERLRQALDPLYWRELNPSLSIDGENSGPDVETTSIGSSERAKLEEDFAGKGYFQIDSLLSHATVEPLKAGIESVRAAGWPGVFSFVYDQFWTASRAPSLVNLLSRILGPGYKQSCHLWSHYVHPQQGAAGWPPHLDNYGRPDRVTVWFALSDATLDNGCLYLIPKDLTPPGIAEKFVKLDTVPLSDLRALLQGGRALPVRAGAVLGWGPEVIHWGAYAAEQTQPRISISQEFVAKSLTRREDEIPLFDTSGTLPRFEQRLYAVGKGILAYQRVETLLIRYLDLAEGLVAATTSGATRDSAR